MISAYLLEKNGKSQIGILIAILCFLFFRASIARCLLSYSIYEDTLGLNVSLSFCCERIVRFLSRASMNLLCYFFMFVSMIEYTQIAFTLRGDMQLDCCGRLASINLRLVVLTVQVRFWSKQYICIFHNDNATSMVV